jgi:hypothetical protein
MTTWPAGTKASTDNLDQGSDSPRLARADLLLNVQNVNSIIDMFNISSPTNNQILKYSTANARFELAADAEGVAASPITFVGDDSTGTAVNTGETFKIAGTQNITTAVSGDTLTITGPNLSAYLTNSPLTIVGDDSTGTTLNTGETIKIAGTQNITTAVSGDTLTITGPSLNNLLTVVGDDSSGVTLNSGETIKFAGSTGITTAVSGDTVTITGPDLSSYLTAVPKTIDVNEISSGDSTAIQINDAVNISGAVTTHGSTKFNSFYADNINALTYSTTITVNANLAPVHKVTLTGNTGFVISNLPTGGNLTLIIVQDGTGSRTATFGTDGSTSVKFAGGSATLSTAINSIDIVNIFNDGTNYYGSLAKAFA